MAASRDNRKRRQKRARNHVDQLRQQLRDAKEALSREERVSMHWANRLAFVGRQLSRGDVFVLDYSMEVCPEWRSHAGAVNRYTLTARPFRWRLGGLCTNGQDLHVCMEVDRELLTFHRSQGFLELRLDNLGAQLGKAMLRTIRNIPIEGVSAEEAGRG